MNLPNEQHILVNSCVRHAKLLTGLPAIASLIHLSKMILAQVSAQSQCGCSKEALSFRHTHR